MSTDRAKLLLELGRHDAAIADLGEAMVQDPLNPTVLLQLSHSFLQRGDAFRSLEFAENALALDAQLERAHRLRSVALLNLNRFEESRQAAEEAVRLAPMEGLAHLTLAEALIAQKRVPGGLEQARRVIELMPSSAVGFDLTGRALMLIGNHYDAELQFRQALHLDPLSAQSMNNLGVCFQQQGREREAVDAFREAARLAPAQALFQNNLRNSARRYMNVLSRVPGPVRILIYLLMAPIGGPALLVLLAVRMVTWQVRKGNLDPTTRMFLDSRRSKVGIRRALRWAPALLCFVGAALVLPAFDNKGPLGAGVGILFLFSAPAIVFWLSSRCLDRWVR